MVHHIEFYEKLTAYSPKPRSWKFDMPCIPRVGESIEFDEGENFTTESVTYVIKEFPAPQHFDSVIIKVQ